MPTDAVLTSTLQHWYTAKGYSAALTGYTFIWKHANNAIAGNDAIHVIVNDAITTTQGPSIDYEYTDPDPPPKRVKYCVQYQENVTHTPYISYGYRLWRSIPRDAPTRATTGSLH